MYKEMVFGASDEILGAIESGVDIERRIFDIYQQCRNDKEIDDAFNALKQENAQILDSQLRETSRSVLDYFDTDVVQKLNMRKETTVQRLGKYQHMMMRLAKAELSNSADFRKDRFEYKGQWYDLNWPAAEAHDARFFRPHEGFGQELIGLAKSRVVDDVVTLVLDYSQLETQRSDVKNLIGQSGELRLEKYTISNNKQRLEYLLIAACLDSGQALEADTARRFARQLPSLKEKLDAKRALKKLERERDEIMLSYHEEKKKIEAKEDELLEEAAAAALEMETNTECLFSVHWHLRESA